MEKLVLRDILKLRNWKSTSCFSSELQSATGEKCMAFLGLIFYSCLFNSGLFGFYDAQE